VLESSGKRGLREAWDIYKRHTQSISITDTLVIRENDLTFVTLQNDEIPIEDNYGYGLYFNDCRFLSGYLLKIMDVPSTQILSSDEKGFESTVIMTNPEFKDCHGNVISPDTIIITRDTVIPGFIMETITVENFNQHDVTLDLSLVFDSDFNDMFTIRGVIEPVDGEVLPIKYDDGKLYLAYKGRDGHMRTTTIEFDPAPEKVEGGTCTFTLSLQPYGSRAIKVSISVEDLKPGQRPEKASVDVRKQINTIKRSYAMVKDCCNNIPTSNNIFNSIMERSLADLNMMRMSLDGQRYHSAGVPWYDTLFGRDSIISALQVLPFEPDIAKSTLLVNAKYQADKIDPWRDEQPGKMLHELRLGELANLNLIPQTPYYGSVDSTPLFLILLAEYIDWTGDMRLFNDLIKNVDAAIKWIDQYGNLDDSGFTSYTSYSPKGIFNQGWKDSWDSVSHADGSLAAHPIALAEVQGYVYMAKRRMATLYEHTGRQDDANRLRREAIGLKQRFNDRYWLKDQKYFAEALDKNGVCDAISSNPGQALWSEIVEPEKARDVVNRMFEEDMYTGWGIRTLSSTQRRYNPLGYHNGTVWPHDNSIIAMGLRKYGFLDELTALFTSMYEAASLFTEYRLPECFGGFSRMKYSIPVSYPVACSPQAWSSGTIPYMLIASLGVVPDALNGRLLLTRPHLPPWLDRVRFTNIKIGNALTDLEFRRIEEDTLVNVTGKRGALNVQIEY
jgi:glycogen debranching enzyme